MFKFRFYTENHLTPTPLPAFSTPLTDIASNGCNYRDPIQVQYASTAYFSEDSQIIPKADFLNKILEQTLDDPQEYIDILSDLNSDNVFSTATDAIFANPDEPPSTDGSDGEGDEKDDNSAVDSETDGSDEPDAEEPDAEESDGEEPDGEGESSSTNTMSSTRSIAGIVGAAVGCTLLAATVVLFRRSKTTDLINNQDHRALNKKAGAGDSTVSSGETLGYSPSIGESQGRFRDAENISLNSHTDVDERSDTLGQTAAVWQHLHRETSDEMSYQDRQQQSSSRLLRKSNCTKQTSSKESGFKEISTSNFLLDTVRFRCDPPATEANEIQSSSADSTSEKVPKRPRTVAEIEMVLAMDTDV
jgi:hypothetical protein